MPPIKTLTLWTLQGHAGTPNPWKVLMLLEELKLPFERESVDANDLKKEPYESLNPNGRVPTLQDPNTGFTIWESGAILEYLTETYDKQNTISFPAGSKEYYEAKQWLHYQMSGQGPYFGQATWFTVYHPEKVPSAVERYVNEIRRVSGVLNRSLENKEYLVGGKYSFVDASFVPWFEVAAIFWTKEMALENDFPNLNSWLNRIKARPAIAKTIEEKAKAAAAAKAAEGK
ncbi:glutathione S- transferase, nitrogen catabolite repression regulator [Onygenales sp. PD_40]|nr:glutathione S- transferase, nitrogen catabolite repression regulator [Onygenales sp. PD_40]KAK2778437.1 glutathione S- transferase, nitrogen catabolite repression regulator [Onygenales sp. PD_12]KAK2781350.1 glutathione S- transferase, nitrogen catabolite repression regulator [Emmonsiellopsis sp. PD_33]KAK2800059.1 glutathione S- transferase, nitrogen catabolite repression regulator [Onygenales sp. PD_10]